MYFSLSRTRDFTRQLLEHLAAVPPELLSKVDVFVIPDFVSLAETAAALGSGPVPVWTGAQDCHWEDWGAFTGEVSPAVLREAGVRIVEVGHAERRRMFGEDDATVARKAAAVSRNGMLPLVCIGERTQGDVSIAVEECRRQVEAGHGQLGRRRRGRSRLRACLGHWRQPAGGRRARTKGCCWGQRSRVRQG